MKKIEGVLYDLESVKSNLLKIYNSKGKIATRDICKINGLPTMDYLNRNYGIKNIIDIYDLLGIEIDSYKLNLLNRKTTTKEDIEIYFNDINIKLIEIVKYDLHKSKVRWICDKCKKEIVSVFNDFKNGARCKKCSNKEGAMARRTSFNEVKSTYENNNCELISLYDEYKNIQSVLKFRCSCGNIDSKSYVSFKLTPKCIKCNIDTGGENHYCWKGGISPLHEHLRKVIYPWKVDSLKKYNYRCDITGECRDCIIHHLHPFHEILNEVIDTLNVPIYKEINAYTKDELASIDKLCLVLHYKYGLGVCLTKEIHNELHLYYGGNKIKINEDDYFKFKKIKLKK